MKDAEKPVTRAKGADLDEGELKEIGLSRERIHETAYPMLEQYCILQKMRKEEALICF